MCLPPTIQPTRQKAVLALSEPLRCMLLSPRIFKAYDIRGTVPSTLTPEVAHLLGRAFGALVREQGGEAVAVGRDGRLSSPALAEVLMSGLSAAGVQVIDIGQSTTPQLYFATHTLCPHGIQVTGSHNPKDDNGFKMVLHRQALYGDAVQDLRQRMEALLASPVADVAPLPATPVQMADVLPAYRARIVQDIQLARRMKVVVDSGNGVAGASAPDLLRAIGCEVQELHSVVDGNFPNHHPDPSRPENLADLVRALRDGDAEVGLAFDGDGDRVAVVTRDGKTIHTDRQLMLLAPDVLTRHPSLGMEVRAYQKIWRLLGVDQFQINGIRAKYWEPDESFVKSFGDVMTPIFSEEDRALPVVCSGQWGGQAVETYARTGRTLDLMYLGGGGIHGHPMGAASGVAAIRQAWEAARDDESLADKASRHPELAAALAKWQV